ncbi:P-II family nitrogen regulator [Echinicola vietnamensis]|uniref:Nitrogen regulatory protein PII n=1 Tax=Echinicola vietnamensis (strain DSM 17526 / LMG 23754 / KMM 6221) TaxID=926556 RepID=L0G451_ECHVK|nr:P-II family nitrogen regulator [Echinicola vietnamensis]AGA80317.1 nitrogen regulatory protein PII [Echinicola vietnamensis DSM 17526]
MKEIKAFIKPKKVQVVVKSLRDAGFESVTLSKGEGTGAHRQEDASPSLDFHFTDSPVVKLELVCQNEEMDIAVQLICDKAQTPEPGDGIIYVSEVDDAYRIKTGKSIKRFDMK